MGYLKRLYRQKTFRYYGIRVLVTAVILLVYLVLWRPARILMAEQVVYPQIKKLETGQQNFQAAIAGGTLQVTYRYYDEIKELHYRPQFGFFLLMALIPMLFMTSHFKPYWLLGGIHLAGTVLAYLCLMIGALGISLGFILTDAINGYLVPGLSLVLVPLIWNGMVGKK